MPRVAIFVFVGNLSGKSVQTKIDTFKGTFLCQIRSSVGSKVIGCWVVNHDTPSASLPPTPTVVSATPTPPLRPPTLKQTSRLSNSIYSPSDHKDAQISHPKADIAVIK
jgi:hypothetical protein